MKIYSLNNFSDINNTIKLCSDSFYDQNYNNENFIEGISEKFYLYANFLRLANNNDDTIGFAAYYSNDIANKKAFLSMIIIRKEFVSNGAGSELLKFIIEDCIIKKMESIVLEVNKKNIKAISFYKKFHFVINNETEDSYFMRLFL